MGTVQNTPLWKQLPALSGLPLYPTGAIYLSLLASASLLLPVLSEHLFPLIALSCTLLFLYFIYIVSAIENISYGKMAPPPWLDMFSKTDAFEIAQHVLLFMMIGFGVRILIAQGVQPMLFVLGIFCIILLPTILMILHVEKSLLTALNPIVLVQFIHSLGIYYIFLLLFSISIAGIMSAFALYASPFLPTLIAHLMLGYLGIYLITVLYFTMGYILYGQKDAFERSDMNNPLADAPKIKATTKAMLQEAQKYINAGNFKEASNFFLKAIASDHLNLELRQQYHELLLETNDLAGLNHHTRSYIRKLISRNQGITAINVFKKVKEKIPDFHLEEVSVAIALAEVMKDIHRYQLAVAVLENLHQYCPNDPLIPDAYLLLAKIQSENLNQDKKAQRVLEYALIHYKNHRLQRELKNYLDCLMKL